jgi:hypothetical protein
MKCVVKSNKPALTFPSHNFITFKRTNKEIEVMSGQNAKVCGTPEPKQHVTRLTYEPGTSPTHSVKLSNQTFNDLHHL